MFRTIRFSIKNLIAAAIIMTLASCGGGGGGGGSEPSQQPQGTISGQVSLGSPATEGRVTAYSWIDGEKGDQLGSSAIDAEGSYSLKTTASSQPILLEVTSAKYKEVTSTANVRFKSNQFLSALINFTKAGTHTAQITSYTTLAHALATYNVDAGTQQSIAITESKDLIAQLIDLDISAIKPARIYSEDDVYAGVSDEAKYGFFLSALSSWMKTISETNNSGEHDYYNSIHAVMVMYRDIKDDGLWDGQIKSASSGESVATSFGKVALNSQVYRQKIAQHALKIINSDDNKSTLVAGDLINPISNFSQSLDPIFAEMEPLTLDEEGPEVVAVDGMDQYFSDEAEYKCTISDISGIKDILVELDGNLIETYELDGEELTVTVDTTEYEDGVYALKITVTDHMDNETVEELDFYMNNGSAVITVTSSEYANQTPFTITGTYFESGPKVKSITVAEVTATLDKTEKTWSAQVPLSVGKNDYEVIFTDELDEEDKFDFSVYLDRNAPEIDLEAGHSDAYFYESGEVIVNQLQDDNSDSLLYFDKDTHSLNGVAQTAEALDTANIAYFTFVAEDPADHTVYTQPEDLEVILTYKIDAEKIGEDIELAPLASDNTKYIIPLTQETLSDDWDQTDEDQLHQLVVTIQDKAENSVSQTFSFKAKFDVPTLTINSLNVDSTVNVYSWAEGTKGSLLETCTTDEDGTCTVRIYEDSAAMLVEVSDGKYRELATGTLVPLGEDDILQAVFNYGQVDTAITVTPITHIAAGLATNMVADGFDAATAVDSANTYISDMYGIDILDDIPFDISNNSNAVDEVNDNLEYSILLGGISSWTNDYALDNGYQNQYQFHSVLFAQLAAEDIMNDGLLNGGVTFGDVEIDQSVYRNGIANGMVDVVNGVRNNTNQPITELLTYIKSIAEEDDAIFDNEPVEALDNESPVIEESNFENGDFFAGNVTLNFTAEDKTAIASIEFDIDGTPKGSAQNILSPSLTFDSTGLALGAHIVGVTATDINGNSSRTIFDINIDNSLITIYGFANSSQVNLYKYSDTGLSEVIATCTTNNTGTCSLRPGVNKQPLIAVLNGGLYRETGAGEVVSITGLQLKTVFNYDAVDTSIAITPITDMSAAYANYLVAEGENLIDAVNIANQKLTQLYGFDVVATIPYSIDNAAANATVEDEDKYSFLLAGISSWTLEAAKTNGVANQSYYNSVLLASYLSADIADDGMLQGADSFGTIQLSPAVYRNEFADNMLSAVNSIQNGTGFGVSDLLDYMIEIAESTDAVFNGAAVTDFDTTAPVVTANNFTEAAYVAGSVPFKFDVEDKLGAKTISATVDGVPVNVAGSLAQPELQIDTSGLVYGDHEIQITVTDLLDNSSTTTFDIKSDNSTLTVNSMNSGSTITAYAWNGGVQGDELDSCLTDSAGTCALNPMTDKQPIILVLTGGQYNEMAAGTAISMGAQTYTAVYNYEGVNQTITINPITKIVASYAGKLILDGASAKDAINTAYSDFTSLYGFNTLTTIPFDIADANNATATVSDAVKYSFLLAGISQWTYDIAQDNGVNQSTYNSQLYALRLSEDIAADRKLNGGVAFGPKSLDQSVYKNEIADSILSVVENTARNKTTLGVADMVPFMQAIAESNHALYDGHAVSEFDGSDPVIGADNFSEGDILSGQVELAFEITDKTEIASVEFSVDAGAVSNGNPQSPVYSIDTTAFANGGHTINVTATDNVGNDSTVQFSITINN